MCGIFGAIGINMSRDKALECVNKLEHRGPDGFGVWQENTITLGHRRLSILDLSENGKQPMPYANERYWLTFNGEIFNFLEVREELRAKGYTFQSESDSEVILAAFCEWKEKCLEKFNGMWAFAIWDRQEQRLFLSRDRFGIKPLYYSDAKPGTFIWGSEMKAIMPVMEHPEADKDMIDYYLAHQHYEMLENCLIKGIKRLPAGHYAWVDANGNAQVKRWWNTLDHLVEVPDNYEEQVEMLRELFMDSCKLRMRSDVTLGTALSGGLDSSATICAMSHIAQKQNQERVNADWQHAYVACFPGTDMDETKYAKQVTDYLGIKSTFLDINDAVSEDELYRQIYTFEDLWNNTQVPMMKVYNQERQSGTIVSLDGHGADELFAGYSFDIIKALADAKSKQDADIIMKAYFAQSELTADLPEAEYIRRRNQAYRDSRIKTFGKKILGKPAVSSAYMNHPNWKQLDTLNKTLFVCTHETVLPTLLRNYDRNSMASGIEIRMPFMDYRVVQFAFSIGWRSKLHNSYSKSIVRDAIAPFMPQSIAYRQNKKGFNAPIGDWVTGPYKEMFLDMVHSADFMQCSLIDNPAAIQEKLDYIVKDKCTTSDEKFRSSQVVWNAIQIFLWEQVLLKNKLGKN